VGLAVADFWRDPRSSDSLLEIVFPKKTQKFLTEFSGLATSGHRNSAMITNAENSLANGLPTACLVSIFTVRITSVFLFGCTLRNRKGINQIFGNIWYPIYCSIVRCTAGSAQSYRYGSGMVAIY